MKSVKDYLPTPSSALYAMCDGLEAGHTEIRMSTFGYREDGICYGCAATNTLLEALPELSTDLLPDLDFDTEEGFSQVGQSYDGEEIAQFERVLDAARDGCLMPLFNFYDMYDAFDEDAYDDRFELKTDNYKEQLPEVRILADELAGKGL